MLEKHVLIRVIVLIAMILLVQFSISYSDTEPVALDKNLSINGVEIGMPLCKVEQLWQCDEHSNTTVHKGEDPESNFVTILRSWPVDRDSPIIEIPNLMGAGFFNDQLIAYNAVLSIGEDQFSTEIADLTKRFGTASEGYPTVVPHDFVKCGLDYYEEYEGDVVQRYYWYEEEVETFLYLVYDVDKQIVLYKLGS